MPDGMKELEEKLIKISWQHGFPVEESHDRCMEALRVAWKEIKEAPHEEKCACLGIWTDQCDCWKAGAQAAILKLLEGGE